MDFFPTKKVYFFPSKSGFLSIVGSYFLQADIPTKLSFNEKSKDQMLQAGLESTKPARSLSGLRLRGILCRNSKFGAFPSVSCHLAPLLTDIQYRSPLKVKIYTLCSVSCGFLLLFRALFSLKENLVRFYVCPAIQCLDLVSKCGPSSGFRSSLGSYFLYRDIIAATKTELQSHSIQTEELLEVGLAHHFVEVV